MTLRRIPCWRLRLSGAVAAIAAAALVALCVGPTAPGALAQGAPPCAALAGRSIEPALIGLPSGPGAHRLGHCGASAGITWGSGANHRLLQGALPAHRTGRADFPHTALRLASSRGTRRSSPLEFA